MRDKTPFKPEKKPFSKDGKSRPGNFGKPKPFERSERPERPPRPQRFEKSDRPQRFDKPRRFEKPFDKPQRPDRPVRPAVRAKPAVKPERQAPEVLPPPVEREDTGMVYGRNAVLELIKSGKAIDKLFVQSGSREGSITVIFAEAVKKSIPVIEVEKAKLDFMIKNSSHQGVIALASEKEYCSTDDIIKIASDRGEKAFILVADKIMDPHNLGAIIRTAECAGAHGIIIPKRNAAGVSPIVAKVSAGASVHMAIAKVANIASTLEELKAKGIWIFSAVSDLNEVSPLDYAEADYDVPLCLVVGNEGEGLAPLVLQKSDFLVKIPMRGKIDSLNVSCASAVLMYEVSRQRKKKTV